MKKSTVILIALIYVASIAIVGFLGLKAKTYNDVIYVDSIEILNEYQVDPKTGNKYIIFRSEGGTHTSLQLQCKVTPDNATDKKIIYALDPDCTTATISEDGLVTFVGSSKPISEKVYIYSNQNTTISDEIVVYYIP